MNQSTHLYKRLLTYAGRYKFFFIVSLLGFILFSAMETALVKSIEYFIKGLETRDAQMMIFVPALVIVVCIFRGIGHYLGAFYISKVGLGVVNDLRKELFAKMVFLPSQFYDSKNSGELVSLIIYNIQQVTGSVTNAVKVAMRDGFIVIGLLSFMVYTNWKLTLVFIFIAPILAGLVMIASRYFRRLSRKMQTTMGGISHIANEALQGFRLVKSFLGEKYEIERFSRASDNNFELAKKYERVSALQGPVFHFVIAIDIAVILFLVLWLWNDDVGSAVAYLSAATAIAKPIRQLSTVNETIQKGLAAAESIFEVMDMPPEQDAAKAPLHITQGRIEFKNLSFQYSEESKAIQNINFAIEPGQTVALVGRSGSGKSTLASLLMRFYEASDGQIVVDGQDIRQVSLASLREQIALVNQDNILFNDTIANNIAYGQDTSADEDIFSAAENASALSFIQGLPEGFETLIGEDGNRLSGGQKQRIAVARALFKNAPILVLDEATSALDNESEKAIQQALENLRKGRTTLIIAHRLSTIEKADKIIVLDNGRIVESGTHQELIGLGGHYSTLHNTQSV